MINGRSGFSFKNLPASASPCTGVWIIMNIHPYVPQRPKKSKISGRQTFTRKNFPDEARQSFPRHLCQKCVICFHDKNAKSCRRIFLHKLCWWQLLWFRLCYNIQGVFSDCRPPKKLKYGKPSESSEFQTVWKLSRLSGNFPDCPETFQTVRKLPVCPETFQTVRTLSRLFGNFPDCPITSRLSDNFQTVGKLSRLSGNFPDCPETFQALRKLSILSGNFLHSPETFQSVWKLSRLSKNFQDRLETFQTLWKLSKLSYIFPDSLETFQTCAMFWVDFKPIL